VPKGRLFKRLGRHGLVRCKHLIYLFLAFGHEVQLGVMNSVLVCALCSLFIKQEIESARTEETGYVRFIG